MTALGAVQGGLLVPPALESPRSPLAVGSYGPLVTAWARKRLHIVHGPWQEYAIGRVLECDSAGDLLARLALLGVGRQNGKSVIVRSIAGWILDEGYKLDAFQQWRFMLFAAHDAHQARIIYNAVRDDVEAYADVDLYGRTARQKGRRRARATLKEGIELNGVRVDVATSQAGSSRGLSPGMIGFDEVLTQTDDRMLSAFLPALSAVHNSIML